MMVIVVGVRSRGTILPLDLKLSAMLSLLFFMAFSFVSSTNDPSALPSGSSLIITFIDSLILSLIIGTTYFLRLFACTPLSLGFPGFCDLYLFVTLNGDLAEDLYS